MGYIISKNKFAPKQSEFASFKIENLHSVAYNVCNFKCKFCKRKNCHPKFYHDYSHNEFKEKVIELMKDGNGFKFTGGEPTLNINLRRDLEIVRRLKGIIYLDTNASNPQIINEALDDNLIDVLGVSLKGINAYEAAKMASIKNTVLAWDNVFETLSHANNYRNVKTIVTYVVGGWSLLIETLNTLVKLLTPFPSIYLKINNVMENKETIKNGLYPIESGQLYKVIKDFVSQNPLWKGRIIIISSELCIGNYDEIIFL